jgi:hypothetical protein
LKNLVILPELVNATHMYSRFNMINAFNKAVQQGCFLLEAEDGTSALSICLKNKAFSAVNAILDYISKNPSFEYSN